MRSLSAVLLATTMLFGVSAFANEEVVRKIVIHGNKRVESGTVFNYLNIKPGDKFDHHKKISAIQALYSSKLFSDVNLKLHNGELVVTVTDAPLITKVEFSGNNRVKKSELTKVITIHRGASFDPAVLKQDIDRIKETYVSSGRYNVKVDARVEHLDNNRVKVTFQIAEGPKTTIKNIYFAGNTYYSASELKSIISTKESAWYRFGNNGENYNPERLEYDKELLVKFYQSVGFADCKVTSAYAELSPKKDHFSVTYVIDEGRKYNIGKVDFANEIKELNNKDIAKLITIKTGKTFDLLAIEEVAEKISKLAARYGYTTIKAYPELKQNPDTQTVDVHFVVQKADRVFVNKINITGNVKTEESVIRRELHLAEGDLLNMDLLEKSDRNVRDLDYFETVKVDASPTENAGKYDVNVDIQEKSTASVGFDLGYSTMDKMFGQISFLEKNLLGTGKILSAKVRKGSKKFSYDTTVIDPHFMDLDLSAGVSLFKINSGRGGSWGEGDLPYSQKAIGARTFIEYELATDLDHEIGYNIKKAKFAHKAGNVAKASSLALFEALGKNTTSSIDHTLTYYQIDSRIVPKNGYILSASQEYAGVGGDDFFIRHDASAKLYQSFNRNQYTLSFVLKGGDIRGTRGKRVKMNDRFNLGDFSLRGFEYAGVGPRDLTSNTVLGGKHYYTLQTEFSVPLLTEMRESSLNGIVFADVGNVWGTDIPAGYDRSRMKIVDSHLPRASTGVGILWLTRIAPIRLDYAIPLKKRHYDDTQRWFFRMSTSF